MSAVLKKAVKLNHSFTRLQPITTCINLAESSITLYTWHHEVLWIKRRLLISKASFHRCVAPIDFESLVNKLKKVQFRFTKKTVYTVVSSLLYTLPLFAARLNRNSILWVFRHVVSGSCHQITSLHYDDVTGKSCSINSPVIRLFV